MSGERVYLFVPAPEIALAQLLGARWDPEARCWYADAGQEEQLWVFYRWMPYEEGDELNVISDAACIASMDVPCQRCGLETEVICIRCGCGLVEGRPLRRFTCTRISALDERLSALLGACYSQLRPGEVLAPEDPPRFVYVNHCVHCGAPHEERKLELLWERCFDADPAWEMPQMIRLIPIEGTVQLRGCARVMAE